MQGNRKETCDFENELRSLICAKLREEGTDFWPKNRFSFYRFNSILCPKGVKCFFLDRVWSLQYDSKASALCEPKTSTATTRGQRAHLGLGTPYFL